VVSTRFNIYPYIETLLATIAYIAIGLYFHPNDPLFIHAMVPFLTILFIVITLFYGQKRGLLSLLLISVILYFHYHADFIPLVLVYLLLILILGQFYHHWHKRYTKSQQEYAYASQRLEELSHAFYTLKISHDTLEKNYALQPHSLRSSIKTLESYYFKEGSHYENFLHLIAQSFQVQGSLLALQQTDDTYQTVASLEETKKLNIQDPLVQKAIQSQETSYVQGHDAKESLYLVVVPVKNHHHEVIALLAIDKMPFLDFNQNNIISIAILFAYFIDQVKLWQHLKTQGATKMSEDALFSYRHHTMQRLNEDYGSASSMLIFKSQDALLHQQLLDVLNKSIRALDILQAFQIEETYIIKVLLPFSAKEATHAMVSKTLDNPLLQNKQVPYMIFDITQKTLIQRYIEESI